VISDQVFKVYKAKLEKIGPENSARLESWVYLQVIDKSWKNHLQSMDSLKDSVSLRGYGQRDPLQEYKKEGFRLFETMMHRIEEETATALISVEIPDEPIETQNAPIDESQMQMRHPSAQSPMSAGVAPGGNGASKSGAMNLPRSREQKESGMIYHGSRQTQEAPDKAPLAQTFKRDADKVGRNDPCPCGSGKKYKKCHGLAGTEASL
jgi:preprotein translocase subunit SecA